MSMTLSIDASKCVGCRTCEVICSLTHSKGLIEPRRSSVRVYREDTGTLILLPLIHGAEGSVEYVAKPYIPNPEKLNHGWVSGVAKECNLCGMCAQWCVTGAITLRKI